MSGKPAARQSDPTACPITGHGTNPITSGSPNVFFDGLPAARQGDPTACGSVLSSNVIPNVLINGKPATVIGSEGDHGNIIIGGSGTIIIGNSHTPASFIPVTPMPVRFSDKIKLVDETTGEPKANHAYAIQRADGSLEYGVSDPMGYTHIVSSHLPENIKFFLED